MNTKTIKTLVVDDEQEGRDLMTNLLSYIPEIKIISCCENADDALNVISSQLPDLVFLDVQMPVKNGFDLLEDLKNLKITHPEFVFVTAYDKYALKALKFSAFDFLLKPVDLNDLKATINKFKRNHSKNNLLSKIDLLFENYSTNKKIKFNTRIGFITLNPNDIFYCLADGNYTRVIMTNGEFEIITNNIGQLENLLPSKKFFRINRSHIINTDFMIAVNKKSKLCSIKYENFREELLIASERIKDLENLF